MAVVTWPLSSGEARGRVGGLVYNTWRGRSYVKTHTDPATQNSDPQLLAREFAATVTAEWHAISDAQRASWHWFGLSHLLPSWTGSPKRLSGYNWFMRLNWQASCLFGLVHPDPPRALPSLLLLDLAVISPSSDVHLTWTPQTPDQSSEWAVSAWREGPYPHPRTPSVKRAVMLDAILEYRGSLIAAIGDPGLYYIHVRLVHDSGATMPFSHLPVVIT